MQPELGDVVRSVDPFKLGEDRQRPWLVVNNDLHPFSDEQFVAVAISTKEYEDSIAVKPDRGRLAEYHNSRSSLRGPFIRPVSKTWSRGRGESRTSSWKMSSPS